MMKIARGQERGEMAITIDPRLEARLRARAESAGLTITAYLERLLHSDQAAEDELETLALEGLNSAAPIAAAPNYWAEKHRLVDERFRSRPGS
jgi:hypothetical protein